MNLTQALADEWAASGVRVNCVNPERTGTPMRTKAFGEEPPGTLLSSEDVARQSLDVLLSHLTGPHHRHPPGGRPCRTGQWLMCPELAEGGASTSSARIRRPRR